MSKKYLLGILAFITAVTMASPGKALAASAPGQITVRSENNKALTYKAGEEKKWTFTVTNNTGKPATGVVIRPELGDTADMWPFQTDYQEYRCDVGNMADKEQKSAEFTFAAREDVATTRYTLQFAVSYVDEEGNEQIQTQKFYVNTTAKPAEKKDKETTGETASYAEESGGISNGDAVYSGGSDSSSGSVPRVIVTGFSTNPSEVRAGKDFTLTVHLKNTSGTSRVQNMLFDLSAPAEGADEQTMAPAFLPASGSSSVYLDGINAGGTADISINLNAKADLLQKPYSIDLAMKYEDGNNAQIEASSSLSIPVKQDARFELSEFEISPESIEVEEEANVMCNLYNLGRIKLYNVKAVFEGACIEKEEIFVGNVESGASASIDAMLKGKKVTKGPAKVTMTLSYEDEAGKISEKKEELKLEVTEAAEETIINETAEEPAGLPVLPIAAITGLLVIGAAAGIIIKRRKKKRMENEEEALLDELDRPSEDERK